MVSSRKRTVEIDVIVDDKQASSKLRGIGDDAQKSGKRFSDLSGGMKAAALGAGAFIATNVVGFLKDAAVNAMADVKAQQQLELAVDNATTATGKEIDALGDYIDKTQAATGITDDQLRPALANLVRATGDVEKAQELMATAMDISTATGKPLETVTMALSKAYMGNVASLGRLGIRVRDTEGDYLSFEEVVDKANETFGGATQQAAESTEGKLARLAIAVDEAKEGFGEMILLPVAEWFADIFGNLEQAGDQNFLDAVLTDVKAIFDETENRKENPGIQALIDSFGALGDMLNIGTTPAVMAVSRATQDARRLGLDPLTGAVVDAVPEFKDAERATDDLRDATEDNADAARDATDAFYDNQDALRASIDPLFAVEKAKRDVAEAQQAVLDAEKEFGTNSPEYMDALAAVRDASYGLRDAEKAVGDQMPVTSETLRQELRGLHVYTEEQIDKIIAEFERVNAFRFRVPRSVSDVRHITGGGPQAHSGGTIPGQYRGQEVPILARAGEFVSQGGRDPSNGHGGGDIIIQVDGREIARAVRPHAVRDSRTGKPWQ